jgi:hypothetical protein
MEDYMLELVVARTALEMMGYRAELAHGVRAHSWGGLVVDAVVTDAEPKVVASVLPGARWEPGFGGCRAFF